MSLTILVCISCNQTPSENCDTAIKTNEKVAKNIKTYKTACDVFFETRDSNAINTDSFDERVKIGRAHV